MLLLHVSAYGQRNPIYTQYMFNGLVLNPAYAGSQKAMMMTASVRSQWSGIDGAPNTQVLTGHAPIKFTRSAAGGVMLHDRAGSVDQTELYAVYAYHIPVSKDAKVSVGMQAGMSYYRVLLSDLQIVTASGDPDAAFASNTSEVEPNLGIGAYYYSPVAYLGLSIPTVINQSWQGTVQDNEAQIRHYYLTGGYVFDLSPDLKLKPNFLVKWVEGGPWQYDVNANLFVKRLFWVGVSYRMQSSVDALLEWNINDQLSFGYSYGYPVGDLRASHWITHEFVLNYRLKKARRVIRSPRVF